MNSPHYVGKRYICLARASVASEGKSSTSAQLLLLHAAAHKLGMIYVDAIALEGLTGSLPGRREDLRALLERKRTANDFDVLVVQRLDRLTRSGPTHGLWFEHECHRAGIHLLFLGEEIPEGRYSNVIKVIKYESAREQVMSLSQRATQGSQLALEQGRALTAPRTPYGCWKVYLNSAGQPTHIIRNLLDGRQQKLDPISHKVIDTYGKPGGGADGHYCKHSEEKVMLIPGDKDQIQVVREIFDLHFIHGWGGDRIANWLNAKGVPSYTGKAWRAECVRTIYLLETYTGHSVGNRRSSALYYERQSGTPKVVTLPSKLKATAKRLPRRIRPREEWFIQEHPLLSNFLEPHVRARAMRAHEIRWNHSPDADPALPKKIRCRNPTFILTGLLCDKEDREPYVGFTTHPGGCRCYRHRHYAGAAVNSSKNMAIFQAESAEMAAMEILEWVLARRSNLRRHLYELIQQANADYEDPASLESLRAQHKELLAQIEPLSRHADADNGVLANQQFGRLRIRAQAVSREIAMREALFTTGPADCDSTYWHLLNRLSVQQPQEQPALMPPARTVPPSLLRTFLPTIMRRGIVDRERNHIEWIVLAPCAGTNASAPEDCTASHRAPDSLLARTNSVHAKSARANAARPWPYMTAVIQFQGAAEHAEFHAALNLFLREVVRHEMLMRGAKDRP